MPATPLDILNDSISSCTRCPRLVRHCRKVAAEKRAAYRDQTYWGRPVPNFGDPQARILLVGLAPGAHGANRTGRMFTGDRSGDFLYRALHDAGLASIPTSTHAADGQTLRLTLITAAAHCAPPDNHPTPRELGNCRPFLEQTFDHLPHLRAVVCLGGIAFNAVLSLYRRRGWLAAPPLPRFAHGLHHQPPPTDAALQPPAILASYHPSQQNTFTGRLTPEMMRDVLLRARALAEA